MLAALLAASLLAGGAAGPASAVPAITLHIWIGEACLQPEGTPGTLHVPTLWDGTSLVDMVSIPSTASGIAWPCFGQAVASGMEVKARGAAARGPS